LWVLFNSIFHAYRKANDAILVGEMINL